MHQTKICTICGKDKPAHDYYVVKKKYLMPECKKCHTVKSVERNRIRRQRNPEAYKAQNKAYYQANKEDYKQWQIDHAEEVKAYKHQWYLDNKEEHRKQAKIRYQKTPRDKLNQQARSNRAKNIDAYRKREREYVKERRLRDKAFRLLVNLRSRVRSAVKSKSDSTKELIGCSIQEFIGHLERQFTPDMSWSNYGHYWEIDHIKPCCSFDLTNPEEQKKCFHYTNCRPLLAKDNRAKIAQDIKQSIRGEATEKTS